MKSEWRVGYRMEGCVRQYCLYRLRDTSISDNPGNREYDRNWYPNFEFAEKAALERNKQESEKTPKDRRKSRVHTRGKRR